MQESPFYGFTMKYTPSQFDSEESANIHYLRTKADIEKRTSEMLKDMKCEFEDDLIAAPLNQGSKFYLGLYFNQNNTPVLGIYQKNKDSSFNYIDCVSQKAMSQISSETWDTLYKRCVRGVSFSNPVISNMDMLYVPVVDKEFTDAFQKNEFNDLTAYAIVGELKKISESDIAYGPYGHSLRVAENSRRFAKYLGYSQEQCHDVFIAALLHDTGKIFIPEEILNKPGSLNDREWEIMQGHARFGAEFLEEHIHAPKHIFEAAAFHHQLSKNYPLSSMKSEDINTIAKIINIIDVYDSIYNKRCYKKEVPKEETERIMGQDAQKGKLDNFLFKQFTQALNKETFDFTALTVKKVESEMQKISSLIQDKLYSFGIGKQEVKEKRERVVKNIDDFKRRYKRNILN